MLEKAKALKHVLRTLLGVATLQPVFRVPSGCPGHIQLQNLGLEGRDVRYTV